MICYLCRELHNAAYDEAGRPCQYADCLSLDPRITPLPTPLYYAPLHQNIPGNKIKPRAGSVSQLGHSTAPIFIFICFICKQAGDGFKDNLGPGPV